MSIMCALHQLLLCWCIWNDAAECWKQHNRFANLQVSDKRKKVSSSSGMQNSVNTSELLKYRASHCVPQRTEAIIKVWPRHIFAKYCQSDLHHACSYAHFLMLQMRHWGARGSVVVKALCCKPEGHGFDSRWGEFLNLPNLSGRPGVYSASNRNEYRKH
jgi:hypothetical protein